MHTTPPLNGSGQTGDHRGTRLERIWMTCLVVFAIMYMGCMTVEMGPRSVVAPISNSVVLIGLVSGTALFLVGIVGACLFSRPD